MTNKKYSVFELISIFISVNAIINVNCVLSDNIFLNTNWTIHNANKSIELHDQPVPSGVYSIVENNKITESVLYSKNDVNLRWISQDSWTYQTAFTLNPNILSRKQIILTLHGVDTIAKVTLNNVELGTTNNMFVRYRYDIHSIVKSENLLLVEFTSPIAAALELSQHNSETPPNCPPSSYHGECHMNFLRKMQASFAWDWGLAAPSMGIWKPVSIEYYDSALIRDVNYVLEDDPSGWIINIKTYLEKGLANDGLKGKLTIHFPQTNHTITNVVNVATDQWGEAVIESKFTVRKDSVELWWPNGYGKQQLYNLQMIWEGTPTVGEELMPLKFARSHKSIRIGFRTIAIIQEPIGKGLSFYFRVNGADIFMKGSNWIPSHILPEKSGDITRIRHLLKSAKYVNMNMLRVWGGGIYEHDLFYELADSYGLLIWQDMMFACAMYPVFSEFLKSTRVEIRQNIRRLQSHPSIAVWAANNENEAALKQNWYGTFSDNERFSNEYRTLYIDVIKDEVESVDKSRECLSSSPSNGKKTETENWLSENPQDWMYGDIHYYNYDLDGWDPNIYPKPRFASEFGFQSYPALNSWESVLGESDNLSDLIPHRQHFPTGDFPITNLIGKHFKLPASSDPNYYSSLIYMSQVSQAMTTKTETEVYRAQRGELANTMGALYWQLNDVWVAPSWSSIDFNGQFKILHNWAKDFLAPVHIIVQLDKLERIQIYVVRDELGNATTKYKIEIMAFHYNKLQVAKYLTLDAEVKPNSAQLVHTIDLDDILTGNSTSENSFVEFRLKSDDNKVLSRNFIFPVSFDEVKSLVDPQIQIKFAASRCSLNVSHVSIQVKVQFPAIFVYLQLNRPSSIKRIFSKNGFILTSPTSIVQMEFDNPNCTAIITEDDIKIITLNQFYK